MNKKSARKKVDRTKQIKKVKTIKRGKPGKTIKQIPIKPRRGRHTDKVSDTQDFASEPEVVIKTIKWPAAAVKQFREKLQRLHDLTVDSIGFLAGGHSAKGDSVVSKASGDGRNTEEDGTENFTQELALLQASNKQDMLNKIIAAFRRLDLGTYGVCETCGDLIAKARLAVQPFAPLCIKCQSAAEANRPRSQGFKKSMVQVVDNESN